MGRLGGPNAVAVAVMAAAAAAAAAAVVVVVVVAAVVVVALAAATATEACRFGRAPSAAASARAGLAVAHPAILLRDGRQENGRRVAAYNRQRAALKQPLCLSPLACDSAQSGAKLSEKDLGSWAA